MLCSFSNVDRVFGNPGVSNFMIVTRILGWEDVVVFLMVIVAEVVVVAVC